MVDGRDWDALFQRFYFVLFCFVRAEGFPGVCIGLLGSFFLGCRVFFSLSLFCWIFWIFPFTCSGGSGVLSHGVSFGLGFHG